MTASKHIFLTGFMGSGKTTHGKKLASILHLPFVDLDQYIESAEGKSVRDIFSEAGEAGFRELETGYLKEVIDRKAWQVVSLGGGTICFHNNLRIIKESGLLIYIEMPAGALHARLSVDPARRPLLKDQSGATLLAFIEETLEARKNFYAQAHITVNGLNLTAQALARRILEFQQEHTP